MSDEQQTQPKQVEVPTNVYVECPLIDRRLRSVTACLKCEHYATLHERFADEKVPFAKRYMVGCCFPTARALFEAEVTDARTD